MSRSDRTERENCAKKELGDNDLEAVSGGLTTRGGLTLDLDDGSSSAAAGASKKGLARGVAAVRTRSGVLIDFEDDA